MSAAFRHPLRDPSVQIEPKAILPAKRHVARTRDLGVEDYIDSNARFLLRHDNSHFCPDAAVTIPCTPEFAGTNSAGHIAFLVRKDSSHYVRTFNAKPGCVSCRYPRSEQVT